MQAEPAESALARFRARLLWWGERARPCPGGRAPHETRWHGSIGGSWWGGCAPPPGASGGLCVLHPELTRRAQAQLTAAQEEAGTLRLVAETLAEERMSKERELLELIETSTERACELAASLSREQATALRLRLLELELAERPTGDDVALLERTAAARLTDAQARAAELEVQLSAVRDAVVSEHLEQLVARTRVLEVELAERVSVEEAAAQEVQLRQARGRIVDAEAAAAAASVEVSRLQQLAAVAPVHRTDLQPRSSAPEGIESQLRRIETLLLSLPPPDLGTGTTPVPALHSPTAAVTTRDGMLEGMPRHEQRPHAPSQAAAGTFVRGPPEAFTLRRHVFTTQA